MPTIKKRFETLVPPEILAEEKGEPPPPPKPNPQEMLAQMEMKDKMSQMEERSNKIQIDESKLDLEKQKLELDQQRMILEAKELQMKMHQSVVNHELDVQKAKIVHSNNFNNKHSVDLFKHLNPNEKASK